MGFSLSTKPFEYVPEWNGNREDKDPITVTLKPLNLADFWELVSLGQRASKTVGGDLEKSPSAEIVKVMADYEPHIEKYIPSIKGVDIDGQAISPKELARHPQFMPLLMEVISTMISRAQVMDVDKKKSRGPSSADPKAVTSGDGSNSTAYAMGGSLPGSP